MQNSVFYKGLKENLEDWKIHKILGDIYRQVNFASKTEVLDFYIRADQLKFIFEGDDELSMTETQFIEKT